MPAPSGGRGFALVHTIALTCLVAPSSALLLVLPFGRSFAPSIEELLERNRLRTMSAPPFVLLYDYRCPFARNVHEHVIAAIRTGLDLDVTFEPFTLNQGHIEEGQLDVWDDPSQDAVLLALEVSVAVRDAFEDQFLTLHGAMFHARHVDGVALNTEAEITPILERAGLNPDAVYEIVATQTPRAVIAKQWKHYHDDLDVFGVPTFIFGDSDATFLRLMTGPDHNNLAASRDVVTQMINLMVLQPEINEFKHTQLSR
jgi:protein-disulfide isomerase-like protein with CxxC motif